MRSLSTSALGQPRETKPTRGGRLVIYLLHKWSFKSFGAGFIASEITDIFISELAEDLTCHFRTAPGTAVKLNIIVRLGT